MYGQNIPRSLFRLLLFFLVTAIFTMTSCKKEKSGLTQSNEITLSSETLGAQPYYSLGYSFESQEFFKRIGSSTDIDIYLNEILVPSGEPVGVQFTTNSVSESTYGFYLNGGFDNLGLAEEFYINYNTATFPSYETLTDTVKKYQVYTYRTWKSNYVKFIVKDMRVIYLGDLADYIEVDIEYFIQRDGSPILIN